MRYWAFATLAALRVFAALAFAAVLSVASPASPASAADTEPSAPGGEGVGNVRRPVDAPNEPAAAGLFTVEGKVEAKTAYLFRGYNLMDGGYILQPEVMLAVNGMELGPYSLTPYAGVWNNLSETKGRDGSIWTHWTEFDATGGVTIERDDWSLDVQWNYYLSPSDFFDSTQELGAMLTYGGDIAGVKLSPHVAVFRELDDQSDGEEDTYLEAAIGPEFDLTEKLTLATQVTAGMSLDGYYRTGSGHNAFLGYGSIGVRPSYKLDEHWAVFAGVEYVYLFADSARAANSGDEGKVIGVAGVAFTY